MDNKKRTKKSSNISRVGRYSLTRTIGKGNFAVVKLGKHDVTKSKVAVKIIDKTSIDGESLRKVYREIQILKQLVHPHIIRLYQVMESDTKLFIITEYASGGEVFEYLRKNNRMSEREARKVFRQIVSAVAYCHTLKIAHRDIKAENLLFAENFDIKLVDFGFSNYTLDHTLLQTWCGSPPYAAPELFLGEKYCGQKADVWSLGVVLYILVCGGFPFPSSSIERLRNAVLEGHVSIPFYVSSECADLIRKMLIVNAKQRLSVKNIVQHRWFTAADWNDDWSDLFTKSLKPEQEPFDESSINYACVAYMQQRGYCAEKVVESIQQKLFDDDYATYYLLCEKLKRKDARCDGGGSSSPSQFTNSASMDPANCGRRGSRGSITTGRVDVDPSTESLLISTVDLAKLGMSSSSEEDAQSTESETSTSSSPSASLQTYLAQRRHTALGVPVGLAFPGGGGPSSTSGNVSFLTQMPVPYPLNCNLGEMSNLANYPYLNLLKQPNMLSPKLMNNMRSNSMACPTSPYNFFPDPRGFQNAFMPAVVPTELLAAAAVAQQQTAAALLAASALGELAAAATSNADNAVSSTSYAQMEEAGAHYLRSRSGATKRHTIQNNSPTTCWRCGATSCICALAAATTAATTAAGGRQFPPASRVHRNEPYNTTPRRVTDSSHLLNPDTLRHLEKLYQNALQRSESPVENMRHLQQEFQQLRATTEMMQPPNTAFSVIPPSTNTLNCCDIWRSSPRSSPPSQVLDMIIEHEPETTAGSPTLPLSSSCHQRQFASSSSVVNSKNQCQLPSSNNINNFIINQRQNQTLAMPKMNGNLAAAPPPTIHIVNDGGQSDEFRN